MWLKGLILEGEIVRNSSVSLSPTLTRNEKVEHHIRIKAHKPIALVSVSYVVGLRSHWCCSP